MTLADLSRFYPELIAWASSTAVSLPITLNNLFSERMKEKKPSRGVVYVVIILAILPVTSTIMAAIGTFMIGKSGLPTIMDYLRSPYHKDEKDE